MTSIRLLAFAFAIAIQPAFLVAQSGVGTLTGIVTDPSGAAIPGCQVSAVNTDTGVISRTHTNQSGTYIAPSLVAGPYRASFECAGFNRREVADLALRVGQQMRVDASMEVGNLAQTVDVSTRGELLQRENAEMSQTITSTDIQNLPVNGRDPYMLIQFTTGVVAGGADPSGPNHSDQLSINGSRGRGNSFVIDGASSLHIGGMGESIGSIEAFSEAKILANTYSAEFGRTAGGVVQFNVKNGTSQYHGSAFEFHRNSALNAGNWQDNLAGNRIATRRIHQFGGTFGGPVPGYRHKLFVFGSFEGQRDRAPSLKRRTVAPADLRDGNFSAHPGTINDPLAKAPFPGSVIPVSRQDPAARKLITLLPAPNSIGTFNPSYNIYSDNYTYMGKTDWGRNFGIGRVDYNPTEKDRFFVTFAHINERRDEGQDFPTALNYIRGATPRDMRRLTITYTRLFSANLSNELMGHAMRDNRTQHPWFGDFDARQELGMQRTAALGMPTIETTGGFGNFGYSRFEQWVNQPAGLNETVTYQTGRHTMRFGGQLFQNQFSYISAGQVAGIYRFNGEITGLGSRGRNNPMNAWADLLLGAVKTAEIPVSQIPVTRTNYNLGTYFNDTWKVSRRLNLNLGLRYEFETRQIVKNNVYSRIDISTGQLLVAGRNASRNLNLANDWLNFGPRLGAAYAVNDKTVVRAGYAMFHANFWIDNGEMVAYPGWTGARTWIDEGVGVGQSFRLSDGAPTEGLQRLTDPFEELSKAAASKSLLSVASVSYGPSAKLPRTEQWNFGIQRSLPWNSAIDVAYVGSRNSNQSRTVPANEPGLAQAEAVNLRGVRIQDARPLPQYSAFSAILYNAYGEYHSFQAKLTRRFRNGFSINGNFTFSKNTDSSSNYSDSHQIPWELPEIEHARASLDRPRSATVGWVWELPFGGSKGLGRSNRVLSAVLGGFQVNGVFSAGDGLPFTITQNRQNLILSAQRPNVVDPSNLSGRMEPVFSGVGRRWLLPRSEPTFPFANSGNLGIGNLGRNTSRDPGYWNMNLSAFRKFRISEQIRLEFRGEAFNALNHVNYRRPVSIDISGLSYGLTTTAAPARQIQLGLRLSF
jgi:hypothetical protein